MSVEQNRPQKGSIIKVDPIRKRRDINSIKKLLADHPRNFALFVIGINTNLRASDLLRLTYDQVRFLNPGDTVEIREKKTNKVRKVQFNKACVEAIRGLVDSETYSPGDLLFKSKKGGAIGYNRLYRLVKSWCKMINLSGNFGAHTLRKTWGYHQRVTFGVDIPTLMVCFNHSTQRQTLDYLCVQPDEIRSVFENEL